MLGFLRLVRRGSFKAMGSLDRLEAALSPERQKQAALERYGRVLGVDESYFAGKRVVDLGCGEKAWFARALAEKGDAAAVWAVEADWLAVPREGEDGEGSKISPEVVAELGDKAIAADFLLDEISLGTEVDSIVSVGALSAAIRTVGPEWFGELQAAVRGLLAKLAPGGEMRLGLVSRPVGEGGDPHGNLVALLEYSQVLRVVEDMNADGFEARLEIAEEQPEQGRVAERIIVRRLA